MIPRPGRKIVDERLRHLLSRKEKRAIGEKGLTNAAVLVPLYQKDGEWHVLFTRRTERVSDHKGQISFPGGARHSEQEALSTTALRESSEEIGLREGDVEIIGELDEVATVSTSYVISPFVAFIPYPYPFQINFEEVAEILEVPLSALLNPANFQAEIQFRQGKAVPVYFYEYNGEVIWGATARILQQFLELLS